MTEDEIPKKEFIEEQRAWLKAHRAELGLSITDLSKRLGFPNGTLSNFVSEKGYAGRELPIAEAVQKYHAGLIARDTTFIDAPDVPGFFQSQTADEIINLLHWCRKGKMVGGAIGSGCGKTTACKEFASRYPHVYVVNLLQSDGPPGPMHTAVLEVLGEENAAGQPSSLSRRIMKRLRTMHMPVLIFDEAQHLTVKSLEEIRGWQEHTGAGVAFFGDKRLHTLIFHGKGKDDIPQFRRRIKMMPVRLQPYVHDVAMQAAAWGIEDRPMIVELQRLAQQPGGLGLASEVLQVAAMIASSEQKKMDIGHLKQAIADRNHEGIAA
ncbi:AAA family ATPase [Novosphingobium naphthalenivorans]|uniref:AAA family ATPase n=1 Tax=Novosphingobium naphthalenivorans TaxID=273168 RepID=UPI0008376C9A|nr:AAA family ATPase [Novosphingobium naphthalenivorans]